MLEQEYTWFFRFAVKAKGHKVEISTLVNATSPNKAWNKLIEEQTARHQITSTDIDILAMNKV